MSLVQDKVPFVVSVLGEQFGEVPEEFAKYKELLTDHIKHWGYAESRDEYFRVLGTSNRRGIYFWSIHSDISAI